LSNGDRKKLEARLTRLADLLAKMRKELAESDARAAAERAAVDRVEQELLAMLADPEQRKRYFAIVDLEEIRENEFNLNVPRYVDTFEPDEEIPIENAVRVLQDCLAVEATIQADLKPILKLRAL
jgi:type I restriction enzyme M protein